MKKKSSHPAFGSGGDFHPQGHDLVGRIAFCWAVAEVEPKALLRLEEEVFPIFCRNNPFLGEEYVADAVQALQIWHTAQAAGEHNELSGALAGWQRAFHLDDSWIGDEAILALWRWHSFEGSVEGFTFKDAWAPSYDSDTRPLPGPLSYFVIPPWDVQTTSASEYKVVVRMLFEDALQRWMDNERERAKLAGLVHVRKARNRHGHGRFSQYEWLARFQVQEMTYDELNEYYRKEYGKRAPSKNAIVIAIRQASEGIGLTRRRRRTKKRDRQPA
jgi:hypothetical protein